MGRVKGILIMAATGVVFALIFYLMWWSGGIHDSPQQLKGEAERYIRSALPKFLTDWN
jgi:hypothetical protein